MAAERMRRRMMNDSSLYNPATLALEKNPRFGPIPGYPPGSHFENRKACADAGVHTKTFAGISGTVADGAFSIVLSGGYEDDLDEGEFFVYTGTGGQQDSFSGSGPQVEDQSFNHQDNYALMKSVETKRPVRVVRGPNRKSKWAPEQGYRYDGLYQVLKAYLDKGESGYAVCKYDLRRAPGQLPVIIGKNLRLG